MGDPDQKERLRARARNILERFIKLQSDRAGIQPVALEKPFAIALSPELAEESPRLTGRIDRIDSTPGGFEVIDYKTGKSTSRSAKDDLQLPIYSLACRQELGRFASRLIYMFLGDGVILETSYTADDLNAVKTEILGIISEINNSDFIATPGYVCASCDFARICPAKQET